MENHTDRACLGAWHAALRSDARRHEHRLAIRAELDARRLAAERRAASAAEAVAALPGPSHTLALGYASALLEKARCAAEATHLAEIRAMLPTMVATRSDLPTGPAAAAAVATQAHAQTAGAALAAAGAGGVASTAQGSPARSGKRRPPKRG